jgi:5'-3' exonuclease
MKTLILDGNNCAHRLGAILPRLTASGKPVQVIYGMLKILRSAISQFEPDAVLVCWDLGRSSFRKTLYPNYKANRKHDKTEEEKKKYQETLAQIQILNEILSLVNVISIQFPETEADDLLAISSQCLEGRKILLTSDRDAYHLISDSVSVWSPAKGKLYTKDNFQKLVGLTPQLWLELRALTGDKGDNISGVARGFGEKTAKELLLKHGSLDAILTEAKKGNFKSGREALLCDKKVPERAYRNLLLMDLRICMSRPDGPDKAKQIQKQLRERHKIDKLAVRKYFQTQKFASLLEGFSIWLKPFEDLEI